MITGAVDFRGNRKVEGRAVTQSLLPTEHSPLHSMEEQRPLKVRPSAAAASPMRCTYIEAPGAACPFSESSASTEARGFNASCTTLTQTPIVFLSSREEEAIV